MATVAGGLLVAQPALAQVNDKALAEALFQQGKQLFDAGKTAEACARFEESQRLEQKLGTLLNLAVCHEKQGKTASAWAEFTEAVNLAEKRGEADRAAFARERATALAAKQSTITIQLKGDAPGLIVVVDGKDLSVHGAALPVDPGRHRVEAKAPGRKPWSMDVDVPQGPVSLTVDVPQLEEDVSAPPPETKNERPAGTAPPTTAKPDKEPDAGIHPAVWPCFGVAVAGVVIGAVTGGLSLSKAKDLKKECVGGVCLGEQREELAEANTLANVSNVAFPVAALGGALGVLVIMVTLPDDPGPVAFVPVGDVGGGFSVGF
ncbi:MAG: tetratricopeptide repeat protein [Polyangiaceae bacterium]|nr:tetratricopeptide repeat protein [Polyangiaceae bacterium]